MAGFFSSVAELRERRILLAAWGIEGAAAGTRALFVLEGNLWTEVCRDPGFPAEAAEEIRKIPRTQNGILRRAEGAFFLETLTLGRKLVICGAGHVSMAVIRLGILLNYEVTVIDDREEFAAQAKAAGAHHVICRPFGEALDEIAGDPSTAFVIMTREHVFDVDCLRLILRKPCAYAGMMGSRSRAEQIRQLLVREGYREEDVRGVHMPIGLPIGSRSPEEIAVSVMAEVIREMNAADAGEGFPPAVPEALAALEAEPEPRAVLAMIVEKNGEAPRRPGTKMLVKADGSFLGTVGGGSAEARILKTAKKMIREGSRESRLERITLVKGTMYCGGEIVVFLLPL